LSVPILSSSPHPYWIGLEIHRASIVSRWLFELWRCDADADYGINSSSIITVLHSL
jgi:hypothetical protein